MNTMKSTMLSTATLLFFSVSVAGAQEPTKRDRFEVDPAVTAEFEAQAKRPYVLPPEAVVEWETAPDAKRQRVSARLMSVGDQSVLVAISVTPADKEALTQIWKVVPRIEDAEHHTIFGDEIFVRYPVALDFELSRLEPKLGKAVELEIGSTMDRRPLVLFVRGS